MTALSRSESSATAHELGWYYILGAFRTAIATTSVADAAAVTAIAAQASESSNHLRAHLVPERVELTLQPSSGHVTDDDIGLARAISDALKAEGYAPDSA